MPIHPATPLTVVSADPFDAADLLRQFRKARRLMAGHLAEPVELDVGVAFINPDWRGVAEANQLLDAHTPADMDPASVAAEVDRHFAVQGVRCQRWTTASPNDPLEKVLASKGLLEKNERVFRLVRALAPMNFPGLTVIPSRSSFRHARELASAVAPPDLAPSCMEAAVTHLDDPHWEGILALRGTKAVAGVGVLSCGQVGLIDQLQVADLSQAKILARVMLDFAIDACARSQFRHVLIGARDPALAALLAANQFALIGAAVSYEAA